MSYKCRYSTNEYQYVLELSQDEFDELMAKKNEIRDKKQEMHKLVTMYEELCPSRVYKTPRTIDIDRL
jgi:hypothetical protein